MPVAPAQYAWQRSPHATGGYKTSDLEGKSETNCGFWRTNCFLMAPTKYRNMLRMKKRCMYGVCKSIHNELPPSTPQKGSNMQMLIWNLNHSRKHYLLVIPCDLNPRPLTSTSSAARHQRHEIASHMTCNVALFNQLFRHVPKKLQGE